MRCDRCRLRVLCRKMRTTTREHFRWTIHNLLAHEASELAWLFGFKRLSDWLLNASLPKLDRLEKQNAES